MTTEEQDFRGRRDSGADAAVKTDNNSQAGGTVPNYLEQRGDSNISIDLTTPGGFGPTSTTTEQPQIIQRSQHNFFIKKVTVPAAKPSKHHRYQKNTLVTHWLDD